MILEKRCEVCSSWKWCERPCRNAPTVAAPPPPKPISDVTIIRTPPGEVRDRLIAKRRERDAVKLLKRPDAIEPKTQASGRGGRPPSGKERIAIRLSSDVLAKFRATGKGWQARIDEALRKAMP